MRTLIELYFQPGAAGNFFSRCLNLLDNAYCYASGTTIPVTIEEKFKLLSYSLVKDRSFDSNNTLSNDPVKNWQQFECQLKHIESLKNYTELPENATVVWVSHSHKSTDKTSSHPNRIFFYIDPSDAFEWMLLNCLYKDSMLEIGFISPGNQLKHNPVVHNISLAKIVQGRDSFIEEFGRACAIFNRELSALETQYILALYAEWSVTTLRTEKFQEFKNQIGWHL